MVSRAVGSVDFQITDMEMRLAIVEIAMVGLSIDCQEQCNCPS
jgi:hypothetical protein